MRGFISIRLVLVAGAILAAFPAWAGDPFSVAATYSASSARIKAALTDLRQTVDEGLSNALDRAADAVEALELGSGPGHEPGHAPNLATVDLDDAAEVEVAPASMAAQSVHGHLSLGMLAIGTGTGGGIALAHPQPIFGLSGDSDGGSDGALGGNAADRALTPRTVELGVQLLPWARLEAARYWWGAHEFVSPVEGTKLGLALSPTDHIVIEGGRTEDRARGTAGFVGLRYDVPLE